MMDFDAADVFGGVVASDHVPAEQLQKQRKAGWPDGYWQTLLGQNTKFFILMQLMQKQQLTPLTCMK